MSALQRVSASALPQALQRLKPEIYDMAILTGRRCLADSGDHVDSINHALDLAWHTVRIRPFLGTLRLCA